MTTETEKGLVDRIEFNPEREVGDKPLSDASSDRAVP
jgi:hypothetical protein